MTNSAIAADAPTFDGVKSAWHGFDRYDYALDEDTMKIAPFAGKGRRCIVVTPKEPAAGNPWSWQGCYWDHEPQTEIELLKRGFHIAYITADANLKPDKKWDAWYAFLVEHGLSKKPAFIGMSRGGEYAYMWATNHPDKVSCIYGDNPGGNPENIMKIEALARNNVPLVHVNGSIDPILDKYSNTMEDIYHQFGGRISIIIKDGAGHHPHSLRDPKLLADFIEQSVRETPADPPAAAGKNFTRSHYYSTESFYRELPSEKCYITCRGPMFVPCFDRFDAWLGFEVPVTIVTPKEAAPGKPWVFRCGFISRDCVVDQALLAKGYTIVCGPVGYNKDGPDAAAWDKVYKQMTDNGLSKKVAMEGAGGAAGEVYAWAIDNPDKVSCVYAENPIMRSHMGKKQPLENLEPLAKAAVPLLHVCGGLDPNLENSTRAVEKRYKELGGKFTLILKEGEGHYPTGPKDTKPVVEFIAAQQEAK